jgi:hypothetical protein
MPPKQTQTPTAKQQCLGITRNQGARCTRQLLSAKYCKTHEHQGTTAETASEAKHPAAAPPVTGPDTLRKHRGCLGITRHGTPCTRELLAATYCHQHKNQAGPPETRVTETTHTHDAEQPATAPHPKNSCDRVAHTHTQHLGAGGPHGDGRERLCRVQTCRRALRRGEGDEFCTRVHRNLQAVHHLGQRYPEGHLCREIAEQFLRATCRRLAGEKRAPGGGCPNALQPCWLPKARLPATATAAGGGPGPGGDAAFLRFARDHLLPLFTAMPHHAPGLCADQTARAHHLADIALSTGARVVRLMDGYGRLALQLLLRLQERGALRDGFRVELVDIDDRVNGFHRALYGELAFVRVLHQDITAVQPDAHTVVYMNFCGLAAARSHVGAFLETYATHGQGRVVLSFSLMRRAKEKSPGWITCFNTRMNNKFTCNRLTAPTLRKDFATYDIVESSALERTPE